MTGVMDSFHLPKKGTGSHILKTVAKLNSFIFHQMGTAAESSQTSRAGQEKPHKRTVFRQEVCEPEPWKITSENNKAGKFWKGKLSSRKEASPGPQRWQQILASRCPHSFRFLSVSHTAWDELSGKSLGYSALAAFGRRKINPNLSLCDMFFSGKMQHTQAHSHTHTHIHTHTYSPQISDSWQIKVMISQCPPWRISELLLGLLTEVWVRGHYKNRNDLRAVASWESPPQQSRQLKKVALHTTRRQLNSSKKLWLFSEALPISVSPISHLLHLQNSGGGS